MWSLHSGMPLPGWPTWNYQYSGLQRVGSRSGKNPPVWRPQRRPSKPEGFVFLGMEQVDKHWCPWNPTWTARATRWLWEKRPTSTRLCIFGFSFALNLHTKRLCLVSILRIGGASSHSTGYKPMNKTYINLVLAQLWVCSEWTNPTYPMYNWSSTASPGGNCVSDVVARAPSVPKWWRTSRWAVDCFSGTHKVVPPQALCLLVYKPHEYKFDISPTKTRVKLELC